MRGETRAAKGKEKSARKSSGTSCTFLFRSLLLPLARICTNVYTRPHTHACTHVHAALACIERVYACVCVCAYQQKFTQRVHIRVNTRRLRAWRTKLPGKRKDVVKKMGGRAGDAARPARRYYTRYDGKLALTVSAVGLSIDARPGGVSSSSSSEETSKTRPPLRRIYLASWEKCEPFSAFFAYTTTR